MTEKNTSKQQACIINSKYVSTLLGSIQVYTFVISHNVLTSTEQKILTRVTSEGFVTDAKTSPTLFESLDLLLALGVTGVQTKGSASWHSSFSVNLTDEKKVQL